MGIFQLSELSCGYGALPVISVPSLVLERGEAMTVVGRNGAGKSTLLRTIAGLAAPLAGTVRFDGLDLLSLRSAKRARHVSMLTQMESLDPSTTVRELVNLGRTPWLGRFGHFSREDRQMVDRALDTCHLSALSDRPLGRVSGGERQRARLAMVLAQNTGIVLLDESTNHLDAAHRYMLHGILRRIRDEQGCIVLMACHSLLDAERFATGILLLREGGVERFDVGEADRLRARIVEDTGVPPEWVY